jgi:hypothetical protein
MAAKILRFVVGALARVVALLVALALLVPVLVVLYTTTDDFRTRLLARLEPELDGRMDGALSIEGLEGSPLTRLRLLDVALAWHGEEIARIDAVGIEVDWTSLLFGRLQIAELALERPAIVFREHAELGWDWRSALAPLIPSPDDPRPPRDEPLPIVIESLAFREGSLTIASLERPAMRLDGLAARGRLDFGEQRLSVADASLELGDSRLSRSRSVPSTPAISPASTPPSRSPSPSFRRRAETSSSASIGTSSMRRDSSSGPIRSSASTSTVIRNPSASPTRRSPRASSRRTSHASRPPGASPESSISGSSS